MSAQDAKAKYIEAMTYLIEQRLHAEKAEIEAGRGQPITLNSIGADELDPAPAEKASPKESERWRKAARLLASTMPAVAGSIEEAQEITGAVARRFQGKGGRVASILDKALDGVIFGERQRWTA